MTVARNGNAPRFEGTPYTAEVDRDADVDTEVKAVTAADADNTVGLAHFNFCCVILFCCQFFVIFPRF